MWAGDARGDLTNEKAFCVPSRVFVGWDLEAILMSRVVASLAMTKRMRVCLSVVVFRSLHYLTAVFYSCYVELYGRSPSAYWNKKWPRRIAGTQKDF